jgi:hypothetical protein
MISKQLEQILVDFIGCAPGEMTQRFQKARDCSLLPRSRGEHADLLTNAQIAFGVLCVVPERPGYAGVRGKALAGLRPVGGPTASFCEAENLGSAIAAAIERPAGLLELDVLDGGFGVNSYGYAAVHHETGTAHYVHRNALILMQRGAERNFDPRMQIRDHEIQRKVTFQAKVFLTISRKVMEARDHRKRLAEFVQ